MSERTKIELQNPIEFDERWIRELSLRPLKARDLMQCERPMPTSEDDRDIRFFLEVASYLSGEVPEVIGELQGADIFEVVRVAANLCVSGLKTGESASEP